MNRWVATINFASAFNTIHHDAIWRDLSKNTICKPHVSLLKKFVSDQCTTVLTDIGDPESEGIKQGGTLSSLLFNSVLEFATEDKLKTWREKGMVIKLREERRPNSLSQFRKMLKNTRIR